MQEMKESARITNEKKTIEAMKEDGCYGNVKVMIGGAPVTGSFAEKIGAHYSSNASEAVDLAKKLIALV